MIGKENIKTIQKTFKKTIQGVKNNLKICVITSPWKQIKEQNKCHKTVSYKNNND